MVAGNSRSSQCSDLEHTSSASAAQRSSASGGGTPGGRGDICSLAPTAASSYLCGDEPSVRDLDTASFHRPGAALEEAARVDGAGPFGVFFKIVLPLIKRPRRCGIFTFRISPSVHARRAF
jgi:hypothetical protein